MAINKSMIKAFEKANNSNYFPKLETEDEAVQFLLSIQDEIFKNNTDNIYLMTTKLVHMLTGSYPYEIQR